MVIAWQHSSGEARNGCQEEAIGDDPEDSGRSLGGSGTPIAGAEAAGVARPAPGSVSQGARRHLVRVENRLPMESGAKGVRVRLDLPQALPGMGAGGHIREALGEAAGAIR